jgi:uncharacterized protein (TIGR03083 family)
MSFDFASIYRSNREGLTVLVVGLDDETLGSKVPATPLWTAKDVFAHVTGVASDFTTGRLDGATTEPWTQRQVDERSDRTVLEIAAEWSELGPMIEAMLQASGRAMSAMVMDVVMHHCDVMGALGIRPAHDDEGLRLCLRASNAIAPRLDAAGLPALRIQTQGFDRVLGTGDHGITVREDAFEIARALFGRRSLDQIAAFDWTADPTPYLQHFSFFTPRKTALEEQSYELLLDRET